MFLRKQKCNRWGYSLLSMVVCFAILFGGVCLVLAGVMAEKVSAAESAHAYDNSDGVFWYQIKQDEFGDDYAVVTGFLGSSSTDLLIKKAGGLEVREIAASAFSGRSGIKNVTIGPYIQKINNNAFYGCPDLESVTIYGDGDTVIDYSAFQGNAKLTTLTMDFVLSLGHGAFGNCANLQSIDFGTTLEEIGGSCFEECTSLTSVVIPDTVTTLGGWAFEGCSSLESVVIGEGVETIGEWCFKHCSNLKDVTFGSHVKVIEDEAFNWCSSIETLEFPDSIRTIGNFAFYSNTSLTSVVFPEGLESLGESAFGDCDSLESVIFPKSLLSLGDEAFCYANSLKEIIFQGDPAMGDDVFTYLPSGAVAYIPYGDTGVEAYWNAKVYTSGKTYLEYASSDYNGDALIVEAHCKDEAEIVLPASIGSYVLDEISSDAFNGEPVKTIVLPNTIVTIGYRAFQDSAITEITIPDSVAGEFDSTFQNCTKLETAVIGNGVEEIAASCFEGCTKLKNVTLGSGVKEIGYCAFFHCSSLEQITMHDGITRIGIMAFSGCSSLKSITIPETVTVIDVQAFRATGLEAIKLPDHLNALGESAFYECQSLKTVVIPHCETLGSYIFTDCPDDMVIYFQDQVLANYLKGSDYYFWRYNIQYDENACILGYDGKRAEITIPEKIPIANIPVVYIGSSAFKQNTALTKVTIGSNIKAIFNKAFYECTNLSVLDWSEGLESIAADAFIRTALENVVIPDSVTTMGTSVFSDCDSLKTIEFGTGLTSINTFTCKDCDVLEKVVFKEGLLEIKDMAFEGCTELCDYNLPSTLKSIGDWTFHLTGGSAADGITIYLPSNLEHIGKEAFESANIGGMILIPSTLTEIPEAAFRNNKIDTVLFYTTIQTISDKAFIENKITYVCINEAVFNPAAFDAGVTIHKHDSDDDPVCDACGRIRYVTVTGLTAPVALQALDGEVVLAESDYATITLSWSPADTVAKYDTVYTATITITPKSGYYFGAVEKVLLDGTEMAVVMNADGSLTISKTFEKTEPDPHPVTPDPVVPDPDPVTPGPDPVTPAPQPAKDPSFEEFIDRLYLYALLREPEADGKAFWMNKVLNEGFTGGRCAYGFLVEAQEFLNRDLTNEQFIDTLYQIFFDRAPDEGGKAFWLEQFGKGMTRAEMVNGFIDSTEWCNLCASYGVKSGAPNAKAEKPSKNAIKFATRLYTECLGREYDADGLQFWALRLTNLESSGYEAAKGFFESKEFTNKNVDDETYVKLLYRTFMGRDYDQGGLEFWLGHLSTDMNRLQVLQGFAQSQEFTNICNDYGIDRGNI